MGLRRSGFLALLGVGAASIPQPAAASLPPWYPLPPPMRYGKGRALVVSGAGARGAYEAGALKWLYRDVDRQGQPFDVLCGTSAGAINAAFAAQGTAAAIGQNEQLWKSMPSANILKLEPHVQNLADAGKELKESGSHGYPAKLRYFGRAKRELDAAGPPSELIKIMGLVDDTGIQNLVAKYPMSIDALRASLIVTATNVTTMSSDSFYHFVGPHAAQAQDRFNRLTTVRPRMGTAAGVPPLRRDVKMHHKLTRDNLVQAVVASAAMPAVFQPVEIKRVESGDTNLYVDGGVANNTPVGLAVDAGATDITVIMADALDEVPSQPSTIPQLLRATNMIVGRKLLENDVTLAIAKNILARKSDWSGFNATTQAFLESLQQKEWLPVVLRVIRPASPLKLSMLGFNNQDDLNAAFDQGYEDAQRAAVYSAG